jgi:hypothetical protein
METLLMVCTVLIAGELLQKLCPEDKMVRFVGSVVALGLLISAVGAVLDVDLDFSLSQGSVQDQQEELNSYLEDEYQEAAQEDGEAYVRGLLASAGLQPEEIRVLTDRNQEGSIVLTEAAAVFAYPSESERARVLLQNVLGEDVRVTVETAG